MRAKELLDAVKRASVVSPEKSPREICEHVLITVQDDRLMVTGTDLENRVETWLPADGMPAITVCLHAGKLLQVLREAGDVDVEIAVEDTKSTNDWARFIVRITIPHGEYELNSADPREFPDRMMIDEKAVRVIASSSGLAALLMSVSYAAAKANMHYSITGTLLELDGSMLRAVASDGHRMGIATLKLDADHGAWKGILHPESVQAMLAVFNSTDSVTLQLDKETIEVADLKTTLRCKLSGDRFPAWRDVIPKAFAHEITIERKALMTAVRQAALLSSDETRAVRLQASAGQLDVVARNSEKGRAKVHRMVLFDGQQELLGFNPDYMLEYLKTTTSEKVHIQFTDKDKPAMFKGENADEMMYLLMPVNVEE